MIDCPANAEPVSQAGFEQLRPQLLGALCNTVSAILAGDAAPSWRRFTNAPAPIAVAVESFMKSQSRCESTATELLMRLREHSPALTWPETPKGLSQLLNKTALNDIDFQSLQDSHGTRSVVLEKITTTAKTSEDAQQVEHALACSPKRMRAKPASPRTKPIPITTTASKTPHKPGKPHITAQDFFPLIAHRCKISIASKG